MSCIDTLLGSLYIMVPLEVLNSWGVADLSLCCIGRHSMMSLTCFHCAVTALRLSDVLHMRAGPLAGDGRLGSGTFKICLQLLATGR